MQSMSIMASRVGNFFEGNGSRSQSQSEQNIESFVSAGHSSKSKHKIE